MFLSVNLVITLSFFSNLSFFNYLAFNMPTLNLYVNFFSKVLYFYYCNLLGNFKYPLLVYYSVILLLNTV